MNGLLRAERKLMQVVSDGVACRYTSGAYMSTRLSERYYISN